MGCCVATFLLTYMYIILVHQGKAKGRHAFKVVSHYHVQEMCYSLGPLFNNIVTPLPSVVRMSSIYVCSDDCVVCVLIRQ